MSNQPEEQIKILEAKCEEYLNGWKRAKADYQNLEKESLKRIKQITEMAAAGFAGKLLPVIDNLDLAVSHIPESDQEKDWVKGIYQIKKQFDDMLESLQIKKIHSLGKQFDHNLHEAVASEESDKKPGEIIKEAQNGYLHKDKVLRPAKVIVSK